MGRPAKKKETPSYIQGEFFETNSSGVYVEVRDRLAVGKTIFDTEFVEQWPSTDLGNGNGNDQYKGTMTIKPVVSEEEVVTQKEFWIEKIKNNILAMSDLTADVLDIITYEWIRHAKHHDSMITISADDILAYRSIQENPGGTGSRGGYKLDQRKQIQEQIEILRHNSIEVTNITIPVIEDGERKLKKIDIKSPVIVVSSEMGVSDVEEDGKESPKGKKQFIWRVRPGDIFTPFLTSPIARRTAIISMKALQYRPDHYPYEKRLTRYLSWVWRIRQDKGNYADSFRVKTILERIHLEINERYPMKTREKLESALNRLEKDRVIKCWQYHPDDFDENIHTKRGWYKEKSEGEFLTWPNWRIIILPPDTIIEYYKENITTKSTLKKELPPLLPEKGDEENIGFRLLEVKLAKGWSFQDMADEIEKATGHTFNKGTLKKIVEGSVPRAKNRRILEEWLRSISG